MKRLGGLGVYLTAALYMGLCPGTLTAQAPPSDTLKGISTAASADSAVPDEKNKENIRDLDKIVVIDKKMKRLPVTERFHTPASSPGIEVLTQEDIEAMGANDIYNVFERALGMGIARQGSRIHNWVQGRGGEKSALGIILDGVYMPATEAQRVLGDLPTEMIQSIRIIRDASIVSMGPLMSPGSNSAGAANQGFIVIETKRTDEKQWKTGEATVGYGSYNQLKVNGFYGQTFDENAGRFGIGYNKSRNDAKKDRFGDWNNAYDANTFLMNGGFSFWKITADLSLFYINSSRDIQRYQEDDGVFGTAVWQYDPMNTRVATLALTGKWNNQHTTQLSGGYTDAIGTGCFDNADVTVDAIVYDRINVSVDTVQANDTTILVYDTTLVNDTIKISRDTIIQQSPRESKDRATEFNLLHTWTIKNGSMNNAFKAGIQMVRWFQQTETRLDETAYPKEENIYGFYLSDELAVSDHLLFDIGGRVDKRYIVKGGTSRSSSGSTIKVDDDTWGSDAYSASLGAVYNFSVKYGVSVRFGLNNTPTPNTLVTVDDKDLDPEIRLKYELGVNINPFEYLNFIATGYYYGINNAKLQVSSINIPVENYPEETVSVGVYGLNDQVSRYGLEFSLQGRNIGPFGYNAGLTLFGSSDSTTETTNPRYKLSAGGDFSHKGFFASVNILKVPDYDVIAWRTNELFPVGDYMVLNASAAYSFNKHLRLRLYVKNLTDEKYTTNYKGVGYGYFYDIGAIYGAEFRISL